MIYYAGIGSRETPKNVLSLMEAFGEQLAKYNHVLRSGGADGADSAFERGARSPRVAGTCEIYLPWKGFNNHRSPLYTVSNEALELASTLHPAWERCSQGARKLHARNCYQVLGQNLDTPIQFVICWTPGGNRGGGTGQALRLAEKMDIKIYDLAVNADRSAIIHYINGLNPDLCF